MFDISSLAVKETAVIDLDNIDGEPLMDEKGKRLSVTVYSPGSREYQAAQARRNSAIMESLRKRGRKLKAAEQRELDANFLADCTSSFNNFGYKGLTGRAAFFAAYSDPAIGWLGEQVNAELADWGNFKQS